MSYNNRYSTLVEAIEDLKKRGYTNNFRVNDEELLVAPNGLLFPPSEVELHEFHRFEGFTNPSDMSILYAVQTHSKLKGTVVDSYGVNGSEATSDFMNKVEQKQFD